MDSPLSLSGRLRACVEDALPALRAIDDAASARRPAPGKWSPRELLGHLVDSASNNHGRFVRALLADGMDFPGYDQDAWVATQRYDEAPWDELVELWRLFNLHLARVVARADARTLARPRHHHDLHRIGFAPVPYDVPATLGGFVADYVDHLEHHLAAVLED